MVGKDHEDYAVLGHFLAKQSGDAVGTPWVSGDAEFYVIGAGKKKLSGETLLPGKQIGSQFYTSVGTADMPMIAGAVQYRAPASGLEPESYVTVLLAIDPATGSIVKQTEVLRTELEGNHADGLTGSGTNAVAFSTTIADPRAGTSTSTTRAFDVITGTKLWERPGYSYGHVLGALTVMTDGKGLTSAGDPCPQAEGIDVATGKVLYNVQLADQAPENCEHPTPTAGGDSVGTRAQAGGRYVRIGSAKVASFDALTGAPVKLPEKLQGRDPLSSLVAGGPALSTTDQPIVVSDALTGAAKFTLEAEKAVKLGAVVEALYDGKLYLRTTDQHPVVDVATGETITTNAPRYPVGAVDKWTFWSDGALEPRP